MGGWGGGGGGGVLTRGIELHAMAPKSCTRSY